VESTRFATGWLPAPLCVSHVPRNRCKAAMLSNGILQIFLLSRTLNLLPAVVFYNRRSRQFLLQCWKPAATRPQMTQVTQGLKGKHYSAVTIELLLVLQLARMLSRVSARLGALREVPSHGKYESS